jgi:HEAT repeat protein
MEPESRKTPEVEHLRKAAEQDDVASLIDAMRDSPLEVKTFAVGLLGTVGGERARLTLVSIARDRWGEHPELRIAALEALASLVEKDGYADFLEQFITDENRRVVAAARRMLKAVDPEGLPVRLVERRALDHAAMKVYGSSGEASAVPLLASYLRERMEAGDIASAGKWGKAYAAVKALGNIAGPASVETLEELLARLEEAPRPADGTLAAARVDKIEAAARQALEPGD